jgi:hypothetical protein
MARLMQLRPPSLQQEQPHAWRWVRALAIGAATLVLTTGVLGVALALHDDLGHGTTPVSSTPPPLWNIVASPTLSSQSPGLEAVSCVSSGDCWAVGDAFDNATTTYARTLIERETAGRWSIVASPNHSAGTNNNLSSVSCVSADDCWAVGSYTGAAGNGQALIERYTGSGWSIVSSPSPSGSTDAQLDGVTCVGAGDCWAVGGYTSAAGASQTLIEQDTVAGWSIVSSATPAGGIELVSVTCASADDCWAVGGNIDSFKRGLPTSATFEQYTGSGWSITPSPAPVSGSDELEAVNCADADDCWAVGTISDATHSPHTLIEQNTGSGWSIVASPPLRGSTEGELNDVTCVIGGYCWAVGSLDLGGTSQQTLVEQNTGSGWGVVSSANPAGGEGPGLERVACVNASDCWAIGEYIASYSAGSARTRPLIEHTDQPPG